MKEIILRFDTKDPLQIKAESSTLSILVLGKLDTENINALAVTLKMTKNNSYLPPIRFTLDLYREERVSDLIQKICQRFECNFSETETTIYAFIEKLESYRFTKLQKQKTFLGKTELSKQEIQLAKKYLGKNNLIDLVRQDLEKIGICSHIDTALLLFIAMSSRKLKKPLSIVLTDNSPIAELLFERLKQCLPESDYFYPNSISPQALFYFSSEELENKVLFLSDLHSKQDLFPMLTQLVNSQSLSKVVTLKDSKTGLPFIMTPQIQTSLSFLGLAKHKNLGKLKPLNIQNYSLKAIDDEIDKWMMYNKKKSAGFIDTSIESEAIKRLSDLQGILQNIDIINPFALVLELPKHHKGNIQLMNFFLRLIASIGFLHQFKRENYVQDRFQNPTKPYILTKLEDIKLALDLIRPIFEKKTEALTKTSITFFENLKKWSLTKSIDSFTTQDYKREYADIPKRTLNHYFKTLTDAGYLVIEGGNPHHGGYRYKIGTQIKEEKTISFEQYRADLIEKLKTID